MNKEQISATKLSSSLISQGGCEYYWWWHYNKKVEPDIVDRYNLDFGTIFHSLAQSYRVRNKLNIFDKEFIDVLKGEEDKISNEIKELKAIGNNELAEKKEKFLEGSAYNAYKRLNKESLDKIQLMVDVLFSESTWKVYRDLSRTEWEKEIVFKIDGFDDFELLIKLDGYNGKELPIDELKTSKNKWKYPEDFDKIQTKLYILGTKCAINYWIMVKNNIPKLQFKQVKWDGDYKKLENDIKILLQEYRKLKTKKFDELKKGQNNYGKGYWKCRYFDKDRNVMVDCPYRNYCEENNIIYE
jgi:hypothetical protein